MHNLITFECMTVVVRCWWKAYTAFEIPNSNYMVGNWNHALLNVQYTICIMVRNWVFSEFQSRAWAFHAKSREKQWLHRDKEMMQIEQGNNYHGNYYPPRNETESINCQLIRETIMTINKWWKLQLQLYQLHCQI